MAPLKYFIVRIYMNISDTVYGYKSKFRKKTNYFLTCNHTYKALNTGISVLLLLEMRYRAACKSQRKINKCITEFFFLKLSYFYIYKTNGTTLQKISLIFFNFYFNSFILRKYLFTLLIVLYCMIVEIYCIYRNFNQS